MGFFKGGALRLFQTFLYALQFICAGLILAIYSYFLSVLADRNEFISKSKEAVEGISGAAVVYLIFAVLLTCCLGGIGFFAFLAIVLDLCFAGGMIAIAVLTRSGAGSCKGNVKTPIGNGPANQDSGFTGPGGNSKVTYAVHLGLACRLNTAVFAVAIIAAVLFIITALIQVALVRHHRKEKRFGPSPANNYTSGSGKRNFWNRKKGNDTTRDAELAGGAGAAGGLAAGGPDMRPSHETGYTGSTMAGANTVAHEKVEGTGHGTHSAYYTAPQGTGINPYGYSQNNNNTTNAGYQTHTNTHTTTSTNY